MGAEAEKIVAPWSPDQVEALNNYQQRGRMHPFTCACNGSLILTATPAGWVCPVSCGYTQDWAWAWMAEPQEKAGALAGDEDLDAPLSPEEEAKLAKRLPAEYLMEKATATAAEAGEDDLAACLGTLYFLWDLGEPGIVKAAAILTKVVTDIRATLAKNPGEVADEPDHRIRAKAEAWDALADHAAHAGAELNTPEVGEELRLLREVEVAHSLRTWAEGDPERDYNRAVAFEARAWDALLAFRERTGA